MAAPLQEESFPHGFIDGQYGEGQIPKTVDELDMIQLSMDIREKSDWHLKIKDPSIVAKWKEEIHNKIEQSDKKFDFVMAELEGYYLPRRGDGSIEPASVDGTWQSDICIPEDLRQEFMTQVQILEDVPEIHKDWHPGSDMQVLDLVHPSLFPFVGGRTRVLKTPMGAMYDSQDHNTILLKFASEDQLLNDDEALKTTLEHTETFPDYCKSKKFQWLPSEVKIGEDGSVQIASYINNLHPEMHSKLYNSIERILERFIPMFNRVLTDLRHPRPNRVVSDGYDWYEDPPPSQSQSQSNDDDDEEDEEEPPKVSKLLEIPTFTPPSAPQSQFNLNGKTIQVIVKLANIHLTPEKPQYKGGSWHIEGMVNERIVTSGIYYYDCENITDSRLLFRQAIQEPSYEQYDNEGVYRVYRLNDEGPLNQHLGSILTKQGRCIAFPNVFQHKVAPFQLADPTRAGHRKILVFFLVDPTIKILSTARVPPQQSSWFRCEVDKGAAVPVPEEIVHKILNLMDWPMKMEEAKRHREALMDERKYFMAQSNEEFYERPFSLCEH